MASHNPVTSNENPDQLNCSQTIEFRGFYHHLKLERNWFMDIRTQTNIKESCIKLPK